MQTKEVRMGNTNIGPGDVDCEVQCADQPRGKRPGAKVPRRRPPVESIRDLTEPDVRRIRHFYRRGMPKRDIRDIYRLTKGQLKAVLRGGPKCLNS